MLLSSASRQAGIGEMPARSAVDFQYRDTEENRRADTFTPHSTYSVAQGVRWTHRG